MVAEEYIIGAGSDFELAAKYKICNADILLRWVEMYNVNRELKDYCSKRDAYMAESRRKTTIEKCTEIVKYCIVHNPDYKETASTYDISYSQVYSWVKSMMLMAKKGYWINEDIIKQMMKWMSWNVYEEKICV